MVTVLTRETLADVNTANEYGIRAIHYAAERNDEELMRMLLDHGANVNGTDYHGRTAVHWLDEEGSNFIRLVNLLLDRGLDINTKDKDGLSYFYSCIRLNRVPLNVIRYLLTVEWIPLEGCRGKRVQWMLLSTTRLDYR